MKAPNDEETNAAEKTIADASKSEDTKVVTAVVE